MQQAPQLDRLNELLAQESKALNLPKFRSEVTRSGSNLQWLKKALAKNQGASEELRILVQKPITELTR